MCCDTFVVIGIRVSVKITTGGPGARVGAEVGVPRSRARPLCPVAVVHDVRHPRSGAGPGHGMSQGSK